MQIIKDQDFHLVKAIQAGDKRAFNQIVLKYQYKILKLLQLYINDRNECLDLVQEVFLKVYKSIYNFQHKSSFYTWLYKITINTAKSYIVDKNRRNRSESSLDNLNKDYYMLGNNLDDNPDLSISLRELENIFHIALNKLPLKLKHSLMLRELDGLSYEEIAEISICPVGTVRSRISRARSAIEKQIQAFK